MPLRTLTTARQVRSLSAAEAGRSYPVHLRAVVTYFDPKGMRGGLFIQDATAGIFTTYAPPAKWPQGPPLPGTLVEVSGITAPGDFAPTIINAQIRVLEPSHLPLHARPVTLSHLHTGTEDCQWVEIEGVVRSVAYTEANVVFEVAMADGTIGAVAPKLPGVDFTRLVDATVRIRGAAAALFNTNMQLTGNRIYFPGYQSLTVEEPGRPDVLAQPPSPLSSLSRFTPKLSWPHRVHVRGIVTLNWPGRSICIQDETQGLCAQSTQTTPLDLGSSADLAGFTALAGFRPSLDDAVFQASPGNHPMPIHIPVITAADALEGGHDFEPVTIEGRLIGRGQEAADTILFLASGDSVFRAVLPTALATSYLAAIRIGSTLNITGICQSDYSATLRSHGGLEASRFWVLLRSPGDVVVLHAASWWTGERLKMLVPFVLLIILAAAVWVVSLRRRVEQQTRELRESRELYRHMAYHDPLTGLATRALLHDRLQNALDRAQRFHKNIALLMLDLDKFKDINDYFGHGTGDQVLRETAKRIRAAIRKTDSVARMGGDEFIVLLNDLVDAGQAEQIAAKIVTALSEPVYVGKCKVPMSVSVGVCTVADETLDADVLMRRVDAAMYRAKERGRGCFQVFTGDMAADLRNGRLAEVRPIDFSTQAETGARPGVGREAG